MKVIRYKRTSRSYEDIFTKSKETKEVQIEIGSVSIDITEHQLGRDLDEPIIFVTTRKNIFTMPMSVFLAKISS